MAHFGTSMQIDPLLWRSQSTATQMNMQQQMAKQMGERIAAEVAQKVKFDMQQDDFNHGYTMRAYLPPEEQVKYIYKTTDSASIYGTYGRQEPPPLPSPTKVKAKVLSWKEFYRQLKQEINEWLDMGEF